MESKIEKAKQVFRKMLVDEYGIKSADQLNKKISILQTMN